MTRATTRRGLRILLVASALWAIFLLGTHVHAPTVEPDRSDCGTSALSVNAEGSSIGGGELRVDQDAFDRACVDRAKSRIRRAVVAGAIFALAMVATLIDRRRAGPPKQRSWRVVRPFGEGPLR